MENEEQAPKYPAHRTMEVLFNRAKEIREKFPTTRMKLSLLHDFICMHINHGSNELLQSEDFINNMRGELTVINLALGAETIEKSEELAKLQTEQLAVELLKKPIDEFEEILNKKRPFE